MTTFTIKLNNPTGLHARPATLVCKEASTFKSNITLKYEDKQGNAKSLIAILALGIPADADVEVVAEGEDEEIAAKKIAEFIASIKEA
ncbi:PTS sugar transporter subunit IIA [Sporanaerobium hydrogeniformans]|uniref:PTS sugar transporter subunit IIA n=1 Tax=Sporanaerobium hydrogeniformans TaxID=3072179 RepID=A0AC61D8M4_9FIRM|nr:HPr family phosphocarrier protein [Sporanaerobium hydrogeniformans]PHV69498.1 PTS sugar transporter subunit IIA [Sporanaerobium hydrogeniformans]